MGRVFAIGDIHGAYLALAQCLERCSFDFENDTLIVLGDVVDGWSDVFKCVELLLKVKNLICIRGNHDDWFVTFLDVGIHPTYWMQGGKGTAESYLREIGKENMIQHKISGYITSLYPGDIPQSHIDFFKKQAFYYELATEQESYCFVHGGFDRDELIEYQHVYILMWDRNLWDQAKSCKGDQKLNNINCFTKIFIGHTHVDDWRNPECKPMLEGGGRVWNLDTGAGWNGKLTIMDIKTYEYWQSDLVHKLYPDEAGRRR